MVKLKAHSRLIVLNILIVLAPINCFADPLNGGISHGIEAFLFKSFGIVLPSIILTGLFLKQTFKSTHRYSVIIYLLSIYLTIICSRYLDKYIYLLERRSNLTYTAGHQADLSDEKLVIGTCVLGISLIVIAFVLTVRKDIKKYRESKKETANKA